MKVKDEGKFPPHLKAMLKSEQRYSLDEKLRSVGHLQKAAHPDTGFPVLHVTISHSQR